NYTRAAEQLSLTQPAVSQHIKQIEREMGTSLFVRSGGKIRPTADGLLVIEYAERVLSLYENLQQALRDRQHSIERLRVGITHTSESNVVTEFLAKYAGQNEKLSITIQTDTINNLYAMLKNYKIDIAIVEGGVQDTDINSIMLDTDFLVCAVSNDSPLAKKTVSFTITCEPQSLVGFKSIGFISAVGVIPAAIACTTCARPISSPSFVM
ncbi:MAG: LysR family transcriptional regulator, partial [Clostridia bacterium]|nr:LysR family transcriptional regulator [Clostridia bacterium]